MSVYAFPSGADLAYAPAHPRTSARGVNVTLAGSYALTGDQGAKDTRPNQVETVPPSDTVGATGVELGDRRCNDAHAPSAPCAPGGKHLRVVLDLGGPSEVAEVEELCGEPSKMLPHMRCAGPAGHPPGLHWMRSSTGSEVNDRHTEGGHG